jgi:hypothetical protein
MRYRHRELSSPSPRLRPARSGISQRSGGTVVELIAYEGASVEPAPQKEHLGYRVIALEVDDMQKALAAGQCVPWHYHTEISDSFVWRRLTRIDTTDFQL